jgi:hypothetical protein
MLRAFVVVPVYLACAYFAPQTLLYQRFSALVVASDDYLPYHLVAYGAGLAGAAILALVLHFGWKPRTYVQSVLHAVLRMGLIGVVFTCGWELFQFFSGNPLSVWALLVPVMFMVAELIYEFVEFVVAEVGKLMGAKQSA